MHPKPQTKTQINQNTEKSGQIRLQACLVGIFFPMPKIQAGLSQYVAPENMTRDKTKPNSDIIGAQLYLTPVQASNGTTSWDKNCLVLPLFSFSGAQSTTSRLSIRLSIDTMSTIGKEIKMSL